jgi:predicted metal-binding protein
MGATLHICMTCKAGLPVVEGEACTGARLFAAITALPVPDGVTIKPAECLSACNWGASVALSKPGAWAYVYGRMREENAADILAGAAAYARTDDGLVPWRERPVIFRKQSIARIPPMER